MFLLTFYIADLTSMGKRASSSDGVGIGWRGDIVSSTAVGMVASY